MPIAVSTLCALGVLLQAQPQAAMDWKAVDRVLGRSGNLQGETYGVGFPRNDLHVTVGAVTVRPALALGSWVAFKQTDDTTAMLMGDLVLVESEVGPVIDALQRGGIEQTALHNHLINDRRTSCTSTLAVADDRSHSRRRYMKPSGGALDQMDIKRN